MIKKRDKILIISCHPDDEILGCGGILLHAKDIGAKCSLVMLGEGESVRYKDLNSHSYINAKNERLTSLHKIIKYFNIKEYIIEERLCNQFDTYPLIEFVRTIERAIKTFKPNIIFTHDFSETNVDHRICFDAVESACRPLNINSVKKIYSYEIPCSASFTMRDKFKPNTFLNISRNLNKKIRLFGYYKKEIRKNPHPRSKENLIAYAKNRGMQSGFKEAEAYRLIREIN